jgi:hypothetical protein
MTMASVRRVARVLRADHLPGFVRSGPHFGWRINRGDAGARAWSRRGSLLGECVLRSARRGGLSPCGRHPSRERAPGMRGWAQESGHGADLFVITSRVGDVVPDHCMGGA